MKILYAARMGRYDLLRPVTALASKITKWTKLCDRMMHRLVCWINSSLDVFMYGWVADPASLLELVLYCDADLAGDRTDAKSTSGVFLCLIGPNSFMPLSAISKKQTSISKSAPEAEIVALDRGLQKEGLPALWIFEKIFGRTPKLYVMEDNAACMRITITGRNPTTQRVRY
jgi:hypothetical protein